MSPVVRKAGARVHRTLEGGLEIVVKVLSFDEWMHYADALHNLNRQRSGGALLDAARKAIGVGLVDVGELSIVDERGKEEPFQLAKTGDEIPRKCFTYLMPWKDEILEVIQNVNILDETDLKNLLSPSATVSADGSTTPGK